MSATAEAPRAPTPKKHCAYWDEDDCRDKCDRGEVEDCFRLGDFYMRYGRHSVESKYATQEMRDKAAAAYQRWMVLTVQSCDAGDEDACRTISNASTRPELPSAPKDAIQRAVDRLAARREAYKRTAPARCDAGELNACLALLNTASGEEKRQVPERYRGYVERFQRACIAGDAAACAGAAALLGKQCPKALTPSWPEAMDMLQRGCNGGDDAQCTELAALLVRHVKGPNGETPKDVEERSRALKLRVARNNEARCIKGEANACFLFARGAGRGPLRCNRLQAYVRHILPWL